MVATHKDSVKPSIYMFPVIQFLVDMLLHAYTAGSDGFLPVDLLCVSMGVFPPPGQRTVSLMIVPTSRRKSRSKAPINCAKS